MLYINKRRTPRDIKDAVEQVVKTPDSGYKELELPQDKNRLRELFDRLPKNMIQNALIEEQHGLCAYCMRRIVSVERTDETADRIRIEHYIPLSKNKESALDYQNFLGVCYGGENDGHEKPFVKCCDAAREDKDLTINPWDSRQMEAIAYEPNGRLYVSEHAGLGLDLVKKMQDDIDYVLCLNGMLDKNKKMQYDTASNLVAHRRQIYDRICTQFEVWAKKNCLDTQHLQEKIELLEKQLLVGEVADPYVGVWLYFYRKKYQKLKRLEH